MVQEVKKDYICVQKSRPEIQFYKRKPDSNRWETRDDNIKHTLKGG